MVQGAVQEASGRLSTTILAPGGSLSSSISATPSRGVAAGGCGAVLMEAGWVEDAARFASGERNVGAFVSARGIVCLFASAGGGDTGPALVSNTCTGTLGPELECTINTIAPAMARQTAMMVAIVPASDRRSEGSAASSASSRRRLRREGRT